MVLLKYPNKLTGCILYFLLWWPLCGTCCCFQTCIRDSPVGTEAKGCCLQGRYSMPPCFLHTSCNLLFTQSWLIQTTETEDAYSFHLPRFPFYFNWKGYGIIWNSSGACIVVVLMTFLLSSCCVQAERYNCSLKGHLLREGNGDAKHTFDNKKL